MTQHGFIELNGNIAVPLVTLLAVGWWLGRGVEETLVATAARSALATFALALLATNQFHFWAHATRRPAVVTWLQARGLILTPAHHAAHHTPPYSGAYCITTGWMDPVFEASRILERCDRVLASVGVPRAPDEPAPTD